MGKLTAVEFVSLDGIIQAPGSADEDASGGFSHGGWSRPRMHDHRRYIAEAFRAADGFLLGRNTYDIFAAFWPKITNPADEIAAALNGRPKFVVSSTLAEPTWQNTFVVRPKFPEAIADIKEERDLLVIGSSSLVHALVRDDLIDEYRLIVHPIILGSGKRLFDRAPDARHLRLVDVTTTEHGLVVTTYRSEHVPAHS